jgi:hypothetical protein
MMPPTRDAASLDEVEMDALSALGTHHHVRTLVRPPHPAHPLGCDQVAKVAWDAIGGYTVRVGRISYVVDDDLHGRAKALAAYQGRTFRAWVERALQREVERQEAERAEDERRRRQR